MENNDNFFIKTQEIRSRVCKIYIYGAGLYARNIYYILKREGISIDGFVVTHIEKDEKLYELPIMNVDKVLSNNIGIIIVIRTKTKLTFIALFLNLLIFLFNNIAPKYCTKFIIFELNILYILAPDNPLKLDVVIVKNSGTDVAYPAISPTVFAFKFKLSANFLNVFTNMYFDIITIKPE